MEVSVQLDTDRMNVTVWYNSGSMIAIVTISVDFV